MIILIIAFVFIVLIILGISFSSNGTSGTVVKERVVEDKEKAVKERCKKRARLELRERRCERQNYVWAILRYIISYEEFANSADFYDFKKSLAAYKESLKRLEDNPPNSEHFDIAFRFCQAEVFKGKCEHPITKEEMQIIRNWKTEKLDAKQTVGKMANSFMEYWDEVLASYKRPSARINRLKYLNEQLDEFAKWPEMQAINGAHDIIQNLKRHYSDMSTQ